MASTALDIRVRAGVADIYTREQVELIKRTVAAGASDDELELFLNVARDVGLNPLLKEVWCVKQLDEHGNPKKDRHGNEYPAQIMVGRDGFLTLAERDGHLDGIVSGVVKEGDVFEFGLAEPVHRFGETRGKLVGAYCYVYRKDRRYPLRVFAEWAEHGAPMTRDAEGKRINKWSPWSKTPSLMIRKVAEANALKLAFRVSGVQAADSPDDDIVDAEVIEDPRPASAVAAGEAQQPADTGSAEPGGDDPHLFPPPDDQLAAEAAAAQSFEDPA